MAKNPEIIKTRKARGEDAVHVKVDISKETIKASLTDTVNSIRDTSKAAIDSIKSAMTGSTPSAATAPIGGSGLGKGLENPFGGSEDTGFKEGLEATGKATVVGINKVFSVLADQFGFTKKVHLDKKDAGTEKDGKKGEPEKPRVISKENLTGGFGIKGIAALFALAAFAKALNVDDIMRLPGQIPAIKSMATFVKGMAKIGTLGFGAKIIDTASDAIKGIGPAIRNAIAGEKGLVGILSRFFGKSNFLSLTPVRTATIQFTKNFTVSFTRFLNGFKNAFAGLKSGIATTLAPFKSIVGALFAEGGALAKLTGGFLSMFKPVTRLLSKLAWPITLIFAIIDGVQGFIEGYKADGIIGGIKGAIVGIVDGFIGSLVRLVTGLLGSFLSFLGLDAMGASITQFGEDVMANFTKALGGLVDFVAGIFTLDLERITAGLGNLVGGTFGWITDIALAPLNLIVNFFKDIFNWGDPETPFNLKDTIMAPVNAAIDWIKGIFKWAGGGTVLFDMGTWFKAIGSGALAAMKAALPGGKSPGEAFWESYDAVMATGASIKAAKRLGADLSETGDAQVAQREEDMKETIEGYNKRVKHDINSITSNMSVITQGASGMTGVDEIDNMSVADKKRLDLDLMSHVAGMPEVRPMIVDQSIKSNNQSSNSSTKIYAGKLNTVVDPYHDKALYFEAMA
jgi:hypothetical protein|tara:strand:+ start:5929 stop:7977 length:2049 start_codon:yes stop_codon:yes gene_type:complete